MSSNFSRRGFFSLFGLSTRGSAAAPRARAETGVAEPVAPVPVATSADRVAIIQGRFCLAYTTFCSVCSERCPVPGAMKVERGIPSVVLDVCTGCGVCHDVCPAPTNAVLVVPRRRALRFNPAPPPPPMP